MSPGTSTPKARGCSMSETNGVLSRMQDKKAEQAVIGSILRDPKMLDDVQAILVATDFFQDAHQRIFKQILKLEKARTPIDTVTLGKALSDNQELEDVGGY